jgi:hypothetical protein
MTKSSGRSLRPKSGLATLARNTGDDPKPDARDDGAQMDDDDHDHGDDIPAGGYRGVARSLAWRCCHAALPVDVRRRIKAGQPVALVVQAPGADWCDWLGRSLARDPTRVLLICRDGSSRSGHKPSEGNRDVAAALADGTSVIGVSQAPSRYLPATLVAVADAHIAVAPPDARILRTMLRRHARGRIPDVPDGIAHGLAFFEIVSAFRAGASARDVVAALVATADRKTGASSDDDDCPPLEKLPGYPESAMRWAKKLAAAVADFKAGNGPFPKDSGVLLWGPPGTGKTLYARALAKSCGLNFVGTSTASWFLANGDLGDVLRGLRSSWEAAVAARPSLWFIDEIQSLPDRSKLDPDRLSWWCSIVDGLLEIVTSPERRGIAIAAASNFPPSRLDAGLVRAGRFGTHLEFPAPDAGALADILRHHLHGALPGVDLSVVTRLAPGATPAEAAGWADALLRMARDAARDPSLDDLIQAVAPPDRRSHDDLRIAAVHEAGHAVAFRAAGRTVASISIVLRGDAGGETRAKGRTPFSPTRADLDAAVVPLLSGRAAEATVLGAVSAGAVADLAAATRLLADAHGAHGLGATMLHRGDPSQALLYDRDLRDVVEADLQRLYARALALVRRRRADVERIAAALIARRFLTGADVDAVLARPAARSRGPKGRKP